MSMIKSLKPVNLQIPPSSAPELRRVLEQLEVALRENFWLLQQRWNVNQGSGELTSYYDSTANWNANRTLVSELGAIYVYYDHGSIDGHDVPGIKVGDGTSYLIDLPFMDAQFARSLTNHINNLGIHVTAADKTFWNNKSAAFMDPEQSETLILANDRIELGGEIISHG